MQLPRALAVSLFVVAFFVFPAVSFADTSFAQLLSQLEQQYQLPSGIIWKVALAENGGKSTGCAPTSSACGMFQFITSTWESATRAMFGQPLDPSLRNSPDISAKVTAFELGTINSQIGSIIAQAKVDPSAGLYLGHFLGSGGAKTLLLAYMQNPGQSACALLASACAANRSVLSQSVSGVINWASQKMQVSGVPNVPGNFADSNGVSYAYSYADIPANGFLPANTVIPANPYGQYATVFPSATNGLVSSTLTGTPQSSTQSTTGTTGTSAGVPSTATTGSACAPQYYCSNNTDYYESAACVTTVFEACQYGCSGTICAAQPSGNVPTSSSVGTSVFNILGTTGNSLFSALSSLAATNSLLTSGIYTIIEGENPASATGTATTFVSTGEYPVYGNETFDANDSGQSYAASGSPISSLLTQLSTALTSLLGYLRSL